MKALSDCSIRELLSPEGFDCDCGKKHAAPIRRLALGAGTIQSLPETLSQLGLRRPCLICGPYGYEAAGQRVCEVLSAAALPYQLQILRPREPGRLKPEEQAVGSACLNFDHGCDCVVAVGSGVINDIGKVISRMARRPLLTVATAPSMDGYASDNASMEVDGIKRSLLEQVPTALICDTDVLTQAPKPLLLAGLGDIFAKITALCDWRLSHIVTGEYYCDAVAKLVERSLGRVMEAAPGVLARQSPEVSALTEGLVLSGLAIAFAGNSHPASGLDHYFSHCWEMMCLEREKPYELHGLQVGVGMLLTLRLAEQLKTERPCMAQVEAAADRFDPAAWAANLRRVFPRAAEELMRMEDSARKNERVGRLRRAERAIENWSAIRDLLDRLPTYGEMAGRMQALGMPTTPEELGLTKSDAADAFVCSRDIRNKYLLSSLIWDLGYMEQYVPLMLS